MENQQKLRNMAWCNLCIQSISIHNKQSIEPFTWLQGSLLKSTKSQHI